MVVERAASRAALASAASWDLDLGFLSSALVDHVSDVTSRSSRALTLKKDLSHLALLTDAPLSVGFLLCGLRRLGYSHGHVIFFLFFVCHSLANGL